MEDVLRHTLVPFLDTRSFLVACQLNRSAWRQRDTCGVDHASLNAYEHLLHGKMLKRHLAQGTGKRRAWLLRDKNSVHAITCTGSIYTYSLDGVMRSFMAIGRAVERVEANHGIVVLGCSRGMFAYCRGSAHPCELHRLCDTRPDDVRAVNIACEDVFQVVTHTSIVTYIWSCRMRRFVWHSRPHDVHMFLPVVATTNDYVRLCDGRFLQVFFITEQNDVLPVKTIELTLRDAHALGTTRDRTHVFVVATREYHTDVAVYRSEDMALVDEVSIDVTGEHRVDGHLLTVVDHEKAHASACYDHRTGRVAYFAGAPEYDACIVDEHVTATFTVHGGISFHTKRR